MGSADRGCPGFYSLQVSDYPGKFRVWRGTVIGVEEGMSGGEANTQPNVRRRRSPTAQRADRTEGIAMPSLDLGLIAVV